MTQLAPTQVPVAEGLFTWPSDEPSLIASQTDGKLHFPPRAGGRVSAQAERRLWALTTQSFRPPSPPYDRGARWDYADLDAALPDMVAEAAPTPTAWVRDHRRHR
jgi:hypothetical protein